MAYLTDNNLTSRETKDGTEIIANFTAEITTETRLVDGAKSDIILTVKGRNVDGRELPEVEVPAPEFAGMNWVPKLWGTDALIYPSSNAKDHLRTSIQIASKPDKRSIYTHTGWARDEKGKEVFVHGNGAIGEKGQVDESTLRLTQKELLLYKLPPKKEIRPAKQATLATLKLLDLFPIKLSAPMLAATIRSVLAPSDFALHVEGRTGTYKSEMAAIWQSHFGPFTSRSLPGSWSSTANALEAAAYKSKDVLFVIDDYVPSGSSWQQKNYAKTADQIIRGQGNQAGRSRLTDTSSLQTTMYPRGLILSTGEDTPEGHSIRARLFILTIDPGAVTPDKLTKAQAAKELYCSTMSHFLQWIARTGRRAVQQEMLVPLGTKFRDQNLEIGHTRTPSTIGNLLAAIWIFTEYCVDQKIITASTQKGIIDGCTESILDTARMQRTYLEAADPVECFSATLRAVLAGKACHLRSRSGGVPPQPERYGWIVEQTYEDETPSYKSGGKAIGWIDPQNKACLLDANIAYETLKKASMGQLTLTKPTMLRRLKEAGVISRIEESRNRNTARVTCGGAVRTVIYCDSSILDEE